MKNTNSENLRCLHRQAGKIWAEERNIIEKIATLIVRTWIFNLSEKLGETLQDFGHRRDRSFDCVLMMYFVENIFY